MKIYRLALVALIMLMAVLALNKLSRSSMTADLSLNDIIYNINENNDIENLRYYMNPLYSDFTLEKRAGKFYLTGERSSQYPWFSYKKTWVIADNNFRIVSLKVSKYDSEEIREVII